MTRCWRYFDQVHDCFGFSPKNTLPLHSSGDKVGMRAESGGESRPATSIGLPFRISTLNCEPQTWLRPSDLPCNCNSQLKHSRCHRSKRSRMIQRPGEAASDCQFGGFRFLSLCFGTPSNINNNNVPFTQPSNAAADTKVCCTGYSRLT